MFGHLNQQFGITLVNRNRRIGQRARRQHLAGEGIQRDMAGRPFVDVQVKLVVPVAASAPSAVTIRSASGSIDGLAIRVEPFAHDAGHPGFGFDKCSVRPRSKIQQQVSAARCAARKHPDAFLRAFETVLAAIGPAPADVNAGFPVVHNVHGADSTFRCVIIPLADLAQFWCHRTDAWKGSRSAPAEFGGTIIHDHVGLEAVHH